MDDETNPEHIIDTCPSCGGAIDVSGELPFAQIYCPHCGEGMRARRIFNNFELVELIGEGGMGSVFKAYDHALNRMVALKVLRREMSAREDERAKLEQEARITASVNHPHVVRVYSFGEAGGQFYLAMELVEKGSLDDLMSIQTCVPEAQVLEIGSQIAQGLEAAAEKGLIHRDVKPGNILFADAHTTKIVDFGLARVLEEEAEARGEIWGTPYYIAPERLNYEPEDLRSDIYSLGATLFHAIAGRPPFEAESASLVALKQLKSQPVSLEAFSPGVAPETAYVINRMLEKDPDERYSSYGELVEHLEFARSKVLERSKQPVAARREVVELETSKTKLYAALFSALAALLLLGAGVWIFLTSDTERIKGMRDAIAAEAAGTTEERMTRGMERLADGKTDQALRLLEGVAEETEDGTLQGQWARLNLAVAMVVADRRAEAVESWKAIRQAGLFSSKPEYRDAANLFLDAADFGSRQNPIRFDDLGKYPDKGQGSLVRFVAGLTDRSLGDKESAARLFDSFRAAAPPADVPWWNAYVRLAERLKEGG